MGVLWALKPFHPRLVDAFLGPFPFVLLAAWTFSNQLLQLFATYCRTAGNEPFMVISIASAAATLLGTLGFGSLAGIQGIAIWLVAHSAVVFVPWGWFIYRHVRAEVAHEQA
jgi:type IV secretory pathway TrbD component